MILICRPSTATNISNIVIFSSVMTVVIIFVQDDLEKGQIFVKEHI